MLFWAEKYLYFFLFLHKNMCCGYSLEESQWDTFKEYQNVCFCGEIRIVLYGYFFLSGTMKVSLTKHFLNWFSVSRFQWYNYLILISGQKTSLLWMYVWESPSQWKLNRQMACYQNTPVWFCPLQISGDWIRKGEFSAQALWVSQIIEV